MGKGEGEGAVLPCIEGTASVLALSHASVVPPCPPFVSVVGASGFSRKKIVFFGGRERVGAAARLHQTYSTSVRLFLHPPRLASPRPHPAFRIPSLKKSRSQKPPPE
jgi:hypothetical protein